MITDTIMVRVDVESIRTRISARNDCPAQDTDIILERVLLALQRQIEQEIREFEDGNGCFESCLFEAI
ncbi:MAG TPA: hypothetical protein PLD82_07210 [Spirochaetota bacterium]|nr:hypothetical protein [Spirochaetota bacterium]